MSKDFWVGTVVSCGLGFLLAMWVITFPQHFSFARNPVGDWLGHQIAKILAQPGE